MENAKQERKKRARRRRFLDDEVHHIYQRTVRRFNIFYDLEDYMVYYTIFALAARQYNVIVLGLCLMFDHIHMLIKTEAKVTMSEFVRQVTSMFAREQNNEVGRKGSLFQARFGSAPKRGMKLLRSAIAYLFNNPVEKRLCDRAEEYQWDFLAYAVSSHPFSDTLIIGQSSRSLKRAIKEVDLAESEDRHLRYCQLRRIFSKLDEKEKMQLTDHIISKYNPFDYDEIIKCYGSYKDMLTAINSNTGSEYDIKEERYRFSDMEYVRMIDILHDVAGLKDIRKVTGLAIDEKMRLFELLRKHLSCGNLPIAKFLHIEATNPLIAKH